jgi:threonine aldolase
MAFADGIADFRSDTVTRPTPEMRRAMADADVGDDVYSDDPTVNALEEEAAAVVGKEAAVFVPTGTMGNQLAIMIQTRPGEEVLCDEQAHCRNIEHGAASAFSGVAFRPLGAPAGRITPDMIDAAMTGAGRLFPRIGMMVWENTHNLSGGRVVPIEVMRAGTDRARAHGLAVHLDGARIFNAAVALGVEPARVASSADTVQFCFSKGLGAPIGSILCGRAEDMAEARYLRKRMGGGMRQVGVIAAPARIALRNWPRLAEDHVLAAHLAGRLAEEIPGSVDPETVDTNMVNLDPESLRTPWEVLSARLREARILVNPPIGSRLRIVTHRDVDRLDVDRLVDCLTGV